MPVDVAQFEALMGNMVRGQGKRVLPQQRVALGQGPMQRLAILHNAAPGCVATALAACLLCCTARGNPSTPGHRRH